MQCPHCEGDLPFTKCPACSREIPDDSRFCCYCGKALPEAQPAAGQAPEDSDYDFSKRILCSDGTCIGVINEHGVCNECGKPYEGEPT